MSSLGPSVGTHSKITRISLTYWFLRTAAGLAGALALAVALVSCARVQAEGKAPRTPPPHEAGAAGDAPGSFPVRGCYGKDSSRSKFDLIRAAGFTVIDRPAFRDALDALPPSLKGFVWLGDYDDKTCTFQKPDDWIRSHLPAIAGHPAIAAYFIADEPHVWDCPSAPAQLKARSALVKSFDPGPPTMVVIEPKYPLPGNRYAPYVGTVDVIAADPYPCSHKNGCVMSKIDDAIRLLEEAKVPRYWAVIQAFADSYYRMPTAEELHDEFRRWRSSRVEGYLVFSWAFRGESLENHSDLIEALKAENTR